ncbi:MAG: glycosyltransferase [Gammaproteobacteria bacterium]
MSYSLFNNKAIVAGVSMRAIGLPVKVVTYRGQTGNISRFDPVSYLTHLSPGVDRIICVAEAVRQSLLPQVWNADKLVTIYKGHDIRWYAGIEPARLDLLGVPPGSFVVTCVANNRPRKGIPQLIAAVGRLPTESCIHVVLVGGGMDGQAVGELLATSAGRARITALGPRADVLPIVAASNATVLPALKREGLPKSVIESMAGIPPIVTQYRRKPRNSSSTVNPGWSCRRKP